MLLLNKVIYIWELIPIPVDSSLIPVQRTLADSGRPPSLDYSQLYIILFQRTPVDSGRTTMWQYVACLESGQVCWNPVSPADSGRTCGWGSVKYCCGPPKIWLKNQTRPDF